MMMDYLPNDDGPTTEAAIGELSYDLSGILYKNYEVLLSPVEPADFKKELLEKLIRESIKEGVEKKAREGGLGSERGWEMMGRGSCEEIIREILRKKIEDFKIYYQKNFKQESTAAAAGTSARPAATEGMGAAEALPPAKVKLSKTQKRRQQRKKAAAAKREHLGSKKRRSRKTSKKNKRKISKRQRKTKRRRSKSK
jgi:hypothetical protein